MKEAVTGSYSKDCGGGEQTGLCESVDYEQISSFLLQSPV